MKKTLCLFLALLMLLGLCACGQSAPANDAAPAEETAEEPAEEIPEVTYSVSVADPDGNPIPGVTLQFCDDSLCTKGETDDSGTAEFTAKEAAACTVHVLQTPVGVVGTEEEYTFPADARETGITLETLQPAAEFPEAGFTYFNPEKYEEIKGNIVWHDSFWIDDDIYILYPRYYGIAEEERAGYRIPRLGAHDYRFEDLFVVVCVHKDESEAQEHLETFLKEMIERFDIYDDWENISFDQIGTAEGVTCFISQLALSEEEQELYQAGMGELYDEFMALREDRETLISGIRLQKPVRKTLLFEAQDLDGNAVSLADVYAGHKVTMVNFWETGCDPCIEIMPYLQELSKTFEEQDCQIIGVCVYDDRLSDADTKPAKFKSIVTNSGVTYPNLICSINNAGVPEMHSSPYFYYVDSEGHILTSPLAGAYYGSNRQAYSDKLELALSRLEG